MIVRKVSQPRLRPTQKQARLLPTHLTECRWPYNKLLWQREIAQEELDISLSKYQPLLLLPLLKEERIPLQPVPSQGLQNTIKV